MLSSLMGTRAPPLPPVGAEGAGGATGSATLSSTSENRAVRRTNCFGEGGVSQFAELAPTETEELLPQ